MLYQQVMITQLEYGILKEENIYLVLMTSMEVTNPHTEVLMTDSSSLVLDKAPLK